MKVSTYVIFAIFAIFSIGTSTSSAFTYVSTAITNTCQVKSSSRVGLNEIDADALVESDGRSGYDGGTAGYTRDLTRKGLFSRFRRISEPGRVWIRHAEDRRREKELYERAMGGCRKSIIKRVLASPFRLAKNVAPQRKPGTLILVRSGQSLGSIEDRFTGWLDPDMSERGYREVQHAARLIKEAGYDIDVVFTSRLKRSIYASRAICNELQEDYLPVFKSWRLNERHYGALTGLTRKDVSMEYGEEMVEEFSDSLTMKPPSLDTSDVRWPGADRRYADLSLNEIPQSESFIDTINRIKPVWEQKIVAELEEGHDVMIVAHANTLRCLMRIIDGVDNKVKNSDVLVPAGVPIVYNFDKNMQPVRPNADSSTSFQDHINGMFLEKPGLLKKALDLEYELKKKVKGYDEAMTRSSTVISNIERSMAKLEAERAIENLADINGSSVDTEEQDRLKDLVIPSFYTNGMCGISSQTDSRKDPVIVMIRHGETGFNKLGLFTGWEDAPLAEEGVEQAKEAGELLNAYGFQFDVVYTSWLSRAIDTAWYVMDKLDSNWVPVIKTWRLNERMYGDLTSKSKKLTARIHGPAQFKAWRRGYKVRPPPVSSFDKNYPGNDKRYVKYLRDLRISFVESLVRSLDRRKLMLVRKFPKSESLHDCMKRTIPYFSQNIVPDAVNRGKRVLIASSENAIRGLLMYLCDIPEELISELSIPNGVPLIYDVRSKCIKLLDDGSGINPLEKHHFGPGAPYLFKPCQNEDGTDNDECDIRWMDDAIWRTDNGSSEKTVDYMPRPKLESVKVKATTQS